MKSLRIQLHRKKKKNPGIKRPTFNVVPILYPEVEDFQEKVNRFSSHHRNGDIEVDKDHQALHCSLPRMAKIASEMRSRLHKEHARVLQLQVLVLKARELAKDIEEVIRRQQVKLRSGEAMALYQQAESFMESSL